ncbi:general transcription and DNA repair factor IIH helicase subunit XPD-like isoform 1-T1 [Morphnus guianensis]
MDFYEKELGEKVLFLGLVLSSRKNLCIHPEVSFLRFGKEVDSWCLSLTASYMQAQHQRDGCLPAASSRIKEKDAWRLAEEYWHLVEGLREASTAWETNLYLANPVLPDEILQEAVPGSVWMAEHFVGFLKWFVAYLRARVRGPQVVQESTPTFLKDLYEKVCIERKPLRFCAKRLHLLLRTLEIVDMADFSAITLIANFATLISTYSKGGQLQCHPRGGGVCPQLYGCLHHHQAHLQALPVGHHHIRDSPLDIYPKIRYFHPVTMATFTMMLAWTCLCPMLSSTSTGTCCWSCQPWSLTALSPSSPATSTWRTLWPPGTSRASWRTSSGTSSSASSRRMGPRPAWPWRSTRRWVAAPQGVTVTGATPPGDLAAVCRPARMARVPSFSPWPAAKCRKASILVRASPARGRGSGGMQWQGDVVAGAEATPISHPLPVHHYGRAVVTFGVPYVYTQSHILKAQLEYLRDQFQIQENDFLTFNTMRHTTQCVGRALRSKTDYGLMVFADKGGCGTPCLPPQCFARADKWGKLPRWIQEHITDTNLNLTVDEAVQVAKFFLRQMAQPFHQEDQLGLSLLTLEKLQSEEVLQQIAQQV